ncbi:sensor domain-containing diguanylate cyclase [Salinimonas lutimaris]|uniref:sensor domain-containing diguanylate cyclase n=1 Tax=Salinimonas lutimaris TaxID=914153 RepID=UPI0010C13271|nr:diguanylate cyclase [Salinimonas lutimaris]
MNTKNVSGMLKGMPSLLLYKENDDSDFLLSDECCVQLHLPVGSNARSLDFFDALSGQQLTEEHHPLHPANLFDHSCQQVDIAAGSQRFHCNLTFRHLAVASDNYCVINIDVTAVFDAQQRSMQASASSHLTYSMMLSSISTRLINADEASVDPLIEECLGTFGQFINADRCYLFRYKHNHTLMDNTHEWAGPDVMPYKDDLKNVPVSEFPVLFTTLQEQGIFRIQDIDNLPPQACKEKAEFEREGIKAILCVAVTLNGGLFGFIGCDILNVSHNWQYHEVRYLKLIGELFSETLHSLNTRQSLKLLQQDLEQANKELERQANMDALTSIANRRFFDLTLAREWANIHITGQPLHLVMLDVDHFKLYNDTYGHQAGDVVLKLIGRVLTDIALEYAVTSARYGGEEFALICPSKSAVTTLKIVEALINNIRKLAIAFPMSPVSSVITVSVGYALAGSPKTDSMQALISRADTALYKAKAEGRNRYSPGIAQALA